jgi:hypothetical protein
LGYFSGISFKDFRKPGKIVEVCVLAWVGNNQLPITRE